MNTPQDVFLEMQPGALAVIHCSHCREEIGQLQTVPESETGSQAETKRMEVEGEINLIADEHHRLCPQRGEV